AAASAAAASPAKSLQGPVGGAALGGAAAVTAPNGTAVAGNSETVGRVVDVISVTRLYVAKVRGRSAGGPTSGEGMGACGAGGGGSRTVEAIGMVSRVPHLPHLARRPALSPATCSTCWHA